MHEKKGDKEELIRKLIKRSNESLAMAEMAIEARFWNSAGSELYYTCFHLIRALLIAKGINAETHRGLKIQFAQVFIKTGVLEEQWGRLLARLFDYRQESDYGELFSNDEGIVSSVKDVKAFRQIVISKLEDFGFKIVTEHD